MVNIEDLKLNKIRRTIKVQKDGEELEINIFNIIGQDRIDFINKLKDSNNENDDLKEMFVEIFKKCTDLEIVGDLEYILSNPTVELMQVQMEIQEIVHELQCEYMMSKVHELNQLETMLLVQLSMKKAERVENLMKTIKELDKQSIE